MDLGVQIHVDQSLQAGQQAVEESQKQFEPIPEGQYVVWLRDYKVESKRKNDVNYRNVNMTFEVQEGEHTNRRIFDLVSIYHEKSEQWATQGRGHIAALGKALGLQQVDSLEPLKFQKVKATILIAPAEKRNGKEYKAKNVIKGMSFTPVDGMAAGQPAQTVQTAATDDSVKPAWMT